jgi:cell division protein FtsN
MTRWRARLVRVASVWGGALLAVALIVGVALWGYGLTQRDASAVPVIRAALTPAKVQPQDPGGAKIAYRDITAYHAGAAGTASPTDIVFAPPPERPSPQDVSMAALSGGATTTTNAAAAPQPPATDTAPAATPLVRPRPADLKQRMEAAKQAVSEQEQLAARAAASPVQIQLGAYPDRDQTQSMWERIYRANQDILRGRALVIQSTISGGRRYFRLRAGPFKDRLEAQNVCRALQSRGQDCLVAVNG